MVIKKTNKISQKDINLLLKKLIIIIRKISNSCGNKNKKITKGGGGIINYLKGKEEKDLLRELNSFNDVELKKTIQYFSGIANNSFENLKLSNFITPDNINPYKKGNLNSGDNIQYNKTFNETLPLQLIKKISNSLFLGLHELKVSKIIHCDIKPNNILIDLVYYKSIKDLFKDIKNKKVKKEDITKFIDIKIIDFNKSEEYKSIYKSLNIQTLYYTPPEIILGNRNYNYSVDVWAVGLILYELTTSLFLFDVYNLNHEYGMNYKNYESDSESNEESESNSESSDSYSYGDDDSFNNLALMHIYKSKLGDNEMRYGKYVNTFYSNDILMGCYQKTNIKKDVEFTELKNILNKSLSNNEKLFYNTIYELFKEIFVYDYNNRLTTEIYFNKFLF
jgi:serine/threonine protein kinase